MQDCVVPIGIVIARIFKSPVHRGSYKKTSDRISAYRKMTIEQLMESVRVMKSPSFSTWEASCGFSIANFAAVSFETAVSMPEAHREKQTE